MDITSGTSTAKNCMILLVEINTINIMGRYNMDKFGLRLTMAPQQKQGEEKYISIYQTHTRKHPNGYSKNTHTYVRD